MSRRPPAYAAPKATRLEQVLRAGLHAAPCLIGGQTDEFFAGRRNHGRDYTTEYRDRFGHREPEYITYKAIAQEGLSYKGEKGAYGANAFMADFYDADEHAQAEDFADAYIARVEEDREDRREARREAARQEREYDSDDDTPYFYK